MNIESTHYLRIGAVINSWNCGREFAAYYSVDRYPRKGGHQSVLILDVSGVGTTWNSNFHVLDCPEATTSTR